jgi:hypothetical protein
MHVKNVNRGRNLPVNNSKHFTYKHCKVSKDRVQKIQLEKVQFRNAAIHNKGFKCL